MVVPSTITAFSQETVEDDLVTLAKVSLSVLTNCPHVALNKQSISNQRQDSPLQPDGTAQAHKQLHRKSLKTMTFFFLKGNIIPYLPSSSPILYWSSMFSQLKAVMVLKKRPIKRIYSQRRDRFPFVDYAQSIYFLYLSSLTSNMSKFQCHKRAGEGRALHHVCLQSGDQRGPLHDPQTLITLVTVPISLWSITHCAHVALNHIHKQ